MLTSRISPCVTISFSLFVCFTFFFISLSTVTWPRGDIILEYGQPLRILCMLSMEYTNEKFPGKNSSDLVFFHNDKQLEPEFITVLNETAIALYIEKPPPADYMYYCKLRLNKTEDDIGVCLNKVAVGCEYSLFYSPPKPPELKISTFFPRCFHSNDKKSTSNYAHMFIPLRLSNFVLSCQDTVFSELSTFCTLIA